jgi:hypothetical protein
MTGRQPPQDQRIDDPEELSQKQRIREILDRRKQTLEARDEAKMSTLMGDVSEEDALLYYRSHLEGLIYELWNVFRNLDNDDGKKYLADKELGTVVIHPPDELMNAVGTWDSGVTPPQPKQHTIQGLRWYIDRGDTVEATFTIQSFDPPQERSETVERVLYWNELDTGLRACLEFMHIAGIDADLAEEEQQTKITRELLEEVDEWRKQQPHIEA